MSASFSFNEASRLPPLEDFALFLQGDGSITITPPVYEEPYQNILNAEKEGRPPQDPQGLQSRANIRKLLVELLSDLSSAITEGRSLETLSYCRREKQLLFELLGLAHNLGPDAVLYDALRDFQAKYNNPGDWRGYDLHEKIAQALQSTAPEPQPPAL